LSLSEIDKRISDLRNEKRQIEDVYKKLAQFLHANAILPINDDFLDYLQYFIREEQMKQNAGAHNTELIASLEKMIVDYTSEIGLFKKTLQEQRDSGDEIEIIQPEEVFGLVGTLYHLPITGKQIRDQVNGIKISQGSYGTQREKFVELPAKAASSKVMLQLKAIVSTRRN
jgi:effector-binding domain-containing protein